MARLLVYETKEPSLLNTLISDIHKWKGPEDGKGWWKPLRPSFAPADGDLELTLTGHSGAVLSVSCNCEKTKIASGSRDNTIRIWDLATGRCERILKDHKEWVNSVQFSPMDKNLLASGSGDGTIYIWNLLDNDSFQLTGETDSKYGDTCVYSLAFHPKGKIIASGLKDGTIRLWNIETRKEEKLLEGEHQEIIRSINFNMKGDLIVSGSKDKKTIVWDWKEKKSIPEKSFEFKSEVHCVAFHSPNIIVSALGNGEVRCGDKPFIKLDPGTKIRSIAFNEDRTKFICASDDNKVRLWEFNEFPPEGKELKTF